MAWGESLEGFTLSPALSTLSPALSKGEGVKYLCSKGEGAKRENILFLCFIYLVMRILNNNNINFSGDVSKLAKPLKVFLDKNSVIPTLLIETGVTLGRTYEASKKGGKKEAVERFVEQGASAVVWLWGVQAIKKIGELAADKLKIDKTQKFKDVNTLASLALATGFIGFVLPKINHFISKKVVEKTSKKEQKKPDTVLKTKSFDDFSKRNKNISFTSNAIGSLAGIIANNNTARLFVTDLGVIAGRFKNGRNKYERIEGLFRDIASIYFYLRATNDFVNLGRKLFKVEKIDLEKLKGLMEGTIKASEKDNKAIKGNFALYAAGTGLSTFALATLIPKIQYAIRNKLTHKDQFPGDEGYKV